MTAKSKYAPRIFQSCLRLCVFVSGVVLILGSATPPPPPPRPTATATASPAPPRPTEDIDETKPHSVVRLVAARPPIPLSDQHVVTIDRRYQVKSQLIGSSWYTTRTSRYIPNGTILVANRNIQFGFGFSSLDLTSREGLGDESVSSVPLGLSLVVRNESARGVTIDWNTVNLIDHAGRAHGVIHRGVKMADRSGVLAPSTIPPGAVLDDFVYPSEVLSFSAGRYGSGWTGVNFFEAMKPQQQFKLYLPLKHGAETVEYQFVFEVGAPEQRGSLVPIGPVTQPVKPITSSPYQLKTEMKYGMTQEEVRSLLGDPNRTEEHSHGTVWFYPEFRSVDFDRIGRVTRWSGF